MPELEALRAELGRILESSSHWDRQQGDLHVEDAIGPTVKLIAVVTAIDGDAIEPLRREVREGLLNIPVVADGTAISISAAVDVAALRLVITGPYRGAGARRCCSYMACDGSGTASGAAGVLGGARTGGSRLRTVDVMRR